MEGFQGGGGDESITHIQFGDNTILFKSSRREEVAILKRILRCLELVAILNIYLSKSVLVGVGCSKETRSTVLGFLLVLANSWVD